MSFGQDTPRVTTSLFVRNLLFSLLVPGVVGVALPWLIASASQELVAPTSGPALLLVGAGFVLYLWCVWQFAHVGRGTPGPWDPAHVFVAVGPYRWVRNPMYIAVLLVIVGQAWLFASPGILVYAFVVAVVVHAFVVAYEEPTLAEQFGSSYTEYRGRVPRWTPRRPSRD